MVPEVLVSGWTPPLESVRMWMYLELRKVTSTDYTYGIVRELTMKKQGDLEHRLGRSNPSGRSPSPSTRVALGRRVNQKEIGA